jgi:hypothetical protein
MPTGDKQSMRAVERVFEKGRLSPVPLALALTSLPMETLVHHVLRQVRLLQEGDVLALRGGGWILGNTIDGSASRSTFTSAG